MSRQDNKKISRKHGEVIYKITFNIFTKLHKSVKFAAADNLSIDKLVTLGLTYLHPMDVKFSRKIEAVSIKKRYVSSKKTGYYSIFPE